MRRKLLSLGLTFLMSGYLSISAQYMKDGYVSYGKDGNYGDDFRVSSYTNDDENFFISRVKPKARFTDKSTQVNKSFVNWWNWTDGTAAANVSRKIAMWTPIGFGHGATAAQSPFMAMPNGIYNSEVFSMWQYISHWGLWSEYFMCMPGNFADVAHKNGVSVSTHVSTSWGTSYTSGDDTWGGTIYNLSQNTSGATAFIIKHGIDGIGWNSEWSGTSLNTYAQTLNEAVAAAINSQWSGIKDPVKGKVTVATDNLWYDGVTNSGQSFDNGLTSSTAAFFVNTSNNNAERSSFFFNYNWNNNSNNGKGLYLPTSATNAKNYGRNPYDNYAGFNLQGKEPHLAGSGTGLQRWTYLQTQEASIGLWSGHDTNMFWEARNTNGSDPYKSQLTYQQLLERWFTGQDASGICSPLSDIDIDESLSNDLNETFFGMSKFVAAQSTLCWDLSTEPFITYFNLGNGKFFNYKGKRQHSSEWYNIGVQDYLPTWRWWWSSDKVLGTTATTSMKAAFDWNDAWFGGSSLRITGSTEANATNYLNLFKTHYVLNVGDVITIRYKINSGDVSDVDLMLVTNSGDGSETLGAAYEEEIINAGAVGDRGLWTEKTITVGTNISNLAAIALKFEGASNLDMNVGELSIKRGTYNAEVPAPTIASTTILSFSLSGIDGKIIYNLDELKLYNIDNGVSMFNIYAKITYSDGTEQITHMGSTTSWAGIFYNCPYDANKLKDNATIRLGVSAVGIDGVTESEIVWGDESKLSYDNAISNTDYVISDEIEVSPNNITNGEVFTVKYSDPQHAAATSWTLVGPYNGKVGTTATIIAAEGTTGFTATANTAITNISDVNLNNLPVGFYDLIVKENGTSRTLKAFVQVYDKDVSYPTLTKLVALDTDGAGTLVHEISAEEAATLKVGDGKTPAREILLVTEDGVKVLEEGKSFTEAGAGAGIKISTANDGQVKPLYLYYEADSKSTGKLSAAAGLDDQALGVKASDLGLTATNQSFTVSFWIKLKSINAKSWLLNIRAPQTDTWPARAWGWMWSDLNTDGTYSNVTVNGSSESNYAFNVAGDEVKFEKNSWYHVAYVFDHSKDTFSFYVNGRKVSYTNSSSGTWNNFKGDYYISIGGMAGKGAYAGFDADIDNFCVFNTALSEDVISSTMVEDPSSESAVSSSLVGFWNFEPAEVGGEIAYEGGYTNKASTNSDAKLIHHYWPTDLDDSATQTMVELGRAVTSLGYPNFSVGGLTVNITPSYTVVGARSYTIDETATGSEIVGSTELGRAASATAEALTAAQVESAPMLFATENASSEDLQTGLKGFAKVTYDAPASGVMNIYTVKLHVDNGIGTDDAEYKYVYVTNWQGGLYTGITDVTDSKVRVFPNPVVDNVFVCVDADGQYKVDVFNIEGKQVASHSERANAGECIVMPANWAQGTYVIRVACNNDTICTVKVNKK
ncbi:MAG: LamG-like jellyroll fold domain-containing protein [Muribaculaceae bacterium]